MIVVDRDRQRRCAGLRRSRDARLPTLVYDRIWCGVREPVEAVRMGRGPRGVALGCVAVGGVVAVVGFFVQRTSERAALGPRRATSGSLNGRR